MKNGVNSCLFQCREFRREILFCMQQILAELEKQRSEYQKVCGCMLQSFLIYLNREGQEEFSFSSPKRTARECLAIKQYIDEHYRNTITLDHLAQISSLNKYYLAHAFREYIGLSPINYLNSRRVEGSHETPGGNESLHCPRSKNDRLFFTILFCAGIPKSCRNVSR